MRYSDSTIHKDRASELLQNLYESIISTMITSKGMSGLNTYSEHPEELEQMSHELVTSFIKEYNRLYTPKIEQLTEKEEAAIAGKIYSSLKKLDKELDKAIEKLAHDRGVTPERVLMEERVATQIKPHFSQYFKKEAESVQVTPQERGVKTFLKEMGNSFLRFCKSVVNAVRKKISPTAAEELEAGIEKLTKLQHTKEKTSAGKFSEKEVQRSSSSREISLTTY